MKKQDEGERRGPSRFLPAHIPETSWISCRNSRNFLKISGIVPSLDPKRFPRPRLMKSNLIEPGKNVPVRTRGYSRLRIAKLR
jgi:hypothetical protein